MGRWGVAGERIPERTQLREYSTLLWVSGPCVLTMIPVREKAAGNWAVKKQGVGPPEPGPPLQPQP